MITRLKLKKIDGRTPLRVESMA
ncbi:hypothetical protein Patl1_11643 [Pistacia atlantica]|uniref:Uncharacterized protein n=1 Tax=Pistacia atlantica TaxID=434234 RepID=A0ACC1A6X5_9ROSI|nr:hypothetical protein Patl1_11643 [Pistacia atlantica]